MRSQSCHTVSSLRFRRWSRKGYAVFVSVTNVVTIGVLATDICEKSASKLSSLSVSSTSAINSESSENAENPEEEVQALTKEILFVAEKQTADVYAYILTQLLITERLLWHLL